jgi:hypothetical protein
MNNPFFSLGLGLRRPLGKAEPVLRPQGVRQLQEAGSHRKLAQELRTLAGR